MCLSPSISRSHPVEGPRVQDITLQQPQSGQLEQHTVEVRSAPLQLDIGIQAERDHPPLESRQVEQGHGAIQLRDQARYQSLPTREALIERAGHPKEDRFFGLIKMSTGYKGLLSGLESYHQETAHKGITEDRLSGLMNHLSHLTEGTVSYLQGSKHTHKEAIGEFQGQIALEATLLYDLRSELKELGGQWPAGLSLKEALDFRREGLGLQEAARLKQAGVAPGTARQFADGHISYQEIERCAGAGLNSDQMAVFLRAGGQVDDIDRLKDGGFNSGQMIAFLQAGGQVDDIDRLKDGGFNSGQMIAFLQAGGKVDDIDAFEVMKFTAAQMVDFIVVGGQLDKAKAYELAGFAPQEAILLEKAGIGVAGGQEYRRLDIPISDKTIVGSFQDSNLVDNKMKELGQGAFNKVYKGTYNTLQGPFVGVYKPEREPNLFKPVERGWVSGMIGIDLHNPQMARRNIACYQVSQLLGFDVIPRTEIGIHNGKLGTVMALAPGCEGAKVIKNGGGHQAFHDPEIRRQLVQLQLFDALVAQGDRHGNNYFIDLATHKVTGIDNDQCFGQAVKDPNEIAHAPGVLHKGYRGVMLPTVIDTEMRDAFRKLTPERLEQDLQGLLTPDEINAAKDRLQAINNHIDQLEQQGRIIPPDRWEGARATTALKQDAFAYYGHTSYVARDLGCYA